MFGLGTVELIIIFAVIMLLFGGKRLPELAEGLGKSIKAFRKEMGNDDAQSKQLAQNATPEKPAEKV